MEKVGKNNHHHHWPVYVRYWTRPPPKNAMFFYELKEIGF